MTKAEYLIKHYSPHILTALGIIGTVTTTTLGIKATPKALKLIEKAKEQKSSELTKKEVIEVAWKPYIPTLLSGFATIGCILSMHILHSRSEASLTSAYAMLNSLHNNYVEKTKELYGEDADNKIRQALVSDMPSDIPIISNGNQLFFDYQSVRYFESSINKVLEAENLLNQEFAASGCVTMNNFYEYLGLEPVSYGRELGWYSPNDYYELQFEHQKCEYDDGLECIIIDVLTPPSSLL